MTSKVYKYMTNYKIQHNNLNKDDKQRLRI